MPFTAITPSTTEERKWRLFWNKKDATFAESVGAAGYVFNF